MPDNNPNWSADEGFWDDAWRDMEVRLDREMPRRKRRFAFWWWTGIGIAALLVGLYAWPAVWQEAVSPTPELVKTELENAEVVTIAENERNTVDQSTTTSLEAVKESLDTKPAGIVAIEVATNTKEQPRLDARPTTILPTESHLDVVAVIPDQLKDDSLSSERSSKENPENTPDEKNNQNLVAEMDALPGVEYRVKSDFKLERKLLNEKVAESLMGKIIDPSPRRSLRYFAETHASHGSHAPGFGYGLAGGVGRGIGEKGQLDLTLGFRATRARFGRPSAGSQDDFNVATPGNPTDSTGSVVDQGIDLIALAEDNGTNYVTSYQLRLGAIYQRQLGQRWTLGPSLGISYLLYGEAPTFLGADPADFVAQEGAFGGQYDNRALNFNSYDDLEAAVGQSTGGDAPRVNRLSVDLGLRVGYSLSRRWQLFSGIDYNMHPVLRSDYFVIDRWRGRFGLRYYIR